MEVATTLTVKTTLCVQLPQVPNYIMLDEDVRRREAGTANKIDIADIDDTQLEEIGAMWTAALVRRAAERRGLQARPGGS